ncbi:uncharacterized protein [Vicugna pacos]|uniref:Collagen alpha-1(I) chain-like n=1 Tax=Vicugna pacos TaxID=30538 RepID=A0ABM5DMA6_VICPA
MEHPRGSSQPSTQTNREGQDRGTGPAQFPYSIEAAWNLRNPRVEERRARARRPPARPPGPGPAVPTPEPDPCAGPGLRAPGLRADAREPAGGRQGAGGSSRPDASPPRSPPRSRPPLTDFHSAVVEARGSGVQGVEAAVQRGGAAAQGSRLALELAEDVPGAARQIGELRQEADQGVRADLLQRAEERRARRPGRLGRAQPRGLHGPLVEGHGGAGQCGRAQRSVRPQSARGASPHPTQRKVRAAAGRRGAAGQLLPVGKRRGGRAGLTDGRAGGEAEERRPPREPKGSGGSERRPPGARRRPSSRRGSRAARREEVRGAAPGRGARRREETRVPLKFAGRQERAGGSFPPSRLEREEEAGEVPPTPGEREGRRKKGKGEEIRAGPGNHLRLPRPPRLAPVGRWPRASANPGGPGTAAQSWGSHVAAPLPAKAPGRLSRGLARPWAGCGEGWGAEGVRRASLWLLTCASARRAGVNAPRPLGTPRGFPLGYPSPLLAKASGLLRCI